MLAEYIRVHTVMEHEQEAQRLSRPRPRLRRNDDPAVVQAAMERYLEAAYPDDRAEALHAFWYCPYPGDPAPLITDADSTHETLRNAAWNALKTLHHPSVRAFALSRLDDTEDAFAVLTANYTPEDESHLMARLHSVEVDFDCTTSWHGDQLNILDIPKPPRAALRYIYDTTYCSCCRFYSLREMGKRRMLTPELLEECQHDSNDEIRAYARRALKRRNTR